MYSLLESNIDVEQFMTTIYRYIQLGVHVRARYDKVTGKFLREVCEVCEFYVTEDNKPEYNVIYRKNIDGGEIINSPSPYLVDYLESQGVDLRNKDFENIKIDLPFENTNNTTVSKTIESNNNLQVNQNNQPENQQEQGNVVPNNQMINDIEEFL